MVRAFGKLADCGESVGLDCQIGLDRSEFGVGSSNPGWGGAMRGGPSDYPLVLVAERTLLLDNVEARRLQG